MTALLILLLLSWQAYKDRLPIKVLQRERQGNWVANTNYALSLAIGEYVCFLHQDDHWVKDRLTNNEAIN